MTTTSLPQQPPGRFSTMRNEERRYTFKVEFVTEEKASNDEDRVEDDDEDDDEVFLAGKVEEERGRFVICTQRTSLPPPLKTSTAPTSCRTVPLSTTERPFRSCWSRLSPRTFWPLPLTHRARRRENAERCKAEPRAPQAPGKKQKMNSSKAQDKKCLYKASQAGDKEPLTKHAGPFHWQPTPRHAVPWRWRKTKTAAAAATAAAVAIAVAEKKSHHHHSQSRGGLDPSCRRTGGSSAPRSCS